MATSDRDAKATLEIEADQVHESREDHNVTTQKLLEKVRESNRQSDRRKRHDMWGADTDNEADAQGPKFKDAPRIANKNLRLSELLFSWWTRQGSLRGGQSKLLDIGCDRIHRTLMLHGDTDVFRMASITDLPVSDKFRDAVPYIILGKFLSDDALVHEAYIPIQKPERLFWELYIGIMKLRGVKCIFSLKDVQRFGLYQVTPRLSYVSGGEGRSFDIMSANSIF